MEYNANKYFDGTMVWACKPVNSHTGNDIIWTGNGSLQLMENEFLHYKVKIVILIFGIKQL